MPKSQLNARVSDLTRRQIDELGERWGTTQTETLTVIIDRMYQQEIKTMSNLANSAHAICNHCGAEYDAGSGNHICEADALEQLAFDEQQFGDPVDTARIAALMERLAQVKEFWRKHPNHQSTASRHMPA